MLDGSLLRHLRSASENHFSALVDSGNTDEEVAVAPHGGVFDLDSSPERNYSDKLDIVAVDTNEFTID